MVLDLTTKSMAWDNDAASMTLDHIFASTLGTNVAFDIIVCICYSLACPAVMFDRVVA
jgi:hypothetical protein